MTCYDASGVQTQCSDTGQDGDYRQGLIWPEPRFVIGADAEADCVTDKLTGLMWLRIPDSTPRTWQESLNYANALNQCGYGDWRMPNIVELYSLYNANEENGASWLNSQGFSNVQSSSSGYWSSTTWAKEPTNALRLSIRYGHWGGSTKTETLYVWPVRGGTGL
jgi:hypothetical protein